jgi:hypothetical protein
MAKTMQRYEVDACGRHAHEGHRTYRELMGDNSHKPWEGLSDEEKAPVRLAVIGIVEGDDDAERSHNRWVNNLRAEGWEQGPRKDRELKTHPNLTGWDELPTETQELNQMFVRSVKSMITALWHLPS